MFYLDYFSPNFKLEHLGEEFNDINTNQKVNLIDTLLDKIYKPKELKNGIIVKKR